jgi:hypothetical protein
MSISSVSVTDFLAQAYSAIESSRLQADIAVSVLKSIQSGQQKQASALVEMIRESSSFSLEGAGHMINRLA